MSSPHCLLKILRPVCITNANFAHGACGLSNYVWSRDLHLGQAQTDKKSGKYDIFAKSFPRKFADENVQGERKEVKSKSDEREVKTIEMKDWSEQSPAWLNKDHDESDLVKHIEVLQRFADRYNTCSTLADSNEKTKSELKEEGRKRLLKILDKQPSKKYSTFVRSLGRKKKDNRPTKRTDKPGAVRSFITLANEPRRRERIAPKPKPIVPTVKNFRNPDSFFLQSTLAPKQSLKPRLYSLVNPKFKNKEFEAFLKKTFLSTAEKNKVKDKKKPEATVGEYFTDRYVRYKPKLVKSEAKTRQAFTAKLQDTLVEERRSATIFPKKAQLEPSLHAKTSLLVQPTHLPLTQCKNMKQGSSGHERSDLFASDHKRPAVPAKIQDPQKTRSTRNESILNRLMKYFKR